MPPTREDLRRAFERHLEYWNKPDREGWIALFDPQVRFDDPVGVPTKHGLEAAARQWDSSFVDGQRWQLYTKPVAGSSIRFKACRLGYLDSEEVASQ